MYVWSMFASWDAWRPVVCPSDTHSVVPLAWHPPQRVKFVLHHVLNRLLEAPGYVVRVVAPALTKVVEMQVTRGIISW